MTPLRCYGSNAVGIQKGIAKRPRKQWIGVSHARLSDREKGTDLPTVLTTVLF